MKVRPLAGLLSAVLTPFLLTVCHGGDSTGPDAASLSWSSVPSGTTANLTGVWGTSASDVWAVGDNVILHYNGANWSVSGTTALLRGIWGSSSSNVWAVGWQPLAQGIFGAALLHYDGTSWSSIPMNELPLVAISGNSASDIWCVTEFGALLHYNGTSWVTAVQSSSANSIWSTSPSDVWAVGIIGSLGASTGSILHYDGTKWSTLSNATTQPLNGVWGTSSSNVWAVGVGPTYHYDGTSWSAVTTPQILGGIWGTSASDIWAVGDEAIRHYNGTRWSTELSGRQLYLQDVWGSSSSNVWVVG